MREPHPNNSEVGDVSAEATRDVGHAPSRVAATHKRDALARDTRGRDLDARDPHRIGDYYLVARFGSNKAIRVFLGYKVSTYGFVHRAVLKWAPATGSDYAQRRASVLDEARALVFVDHPSITKILHVDEDGSGTHLAIEYVPGSDLGAIARRLCDMGERLPIPLACYIVANVLYALEHAHTARDYDGQPCELVHRDVNPSNILVSRDGYIKLTDFGFVRMRDRLQGPTLPGRVKGKFQYLAPEYLAGQECTASCDLYGVGVTLFELLAGRMCFTQSTRMNLVQAILREGVPVDDLAPLGVPSPLIEIARRATARDPTARYPSASAMVCAIEAWLSDTGTHVSPRLLREHIDEKGLAETRNALVDAEDDVEISVV